MSKKKVELTDEQKQKIVDEVNSEDEEEYGNTTISSIADDPDAKEMMDKVNPKNLYENQIASNFRSTYHLGQLLPSLSKKNLIKLLMFVCKLPEKDGYIKFGGTKKDQQTANEAFIQAQVASNSKTYIMSVDAAARSKLEKQKAQTEQQGEKNEQ